MVLGSAIGSELLLDRIQQVAVRLGVDFAPQDLLGAGDRERGDLVAQLLARARYLLLDLGLGGRLFAVAFFLGGIARLFDHLRGALLGLGDHLGRAAARLADRFVGLLGGDLERLAA